jgi:hypothetical protein
MFREIKPTAVLLAFAFVSTAWPQETQPSEPANAPPSASSAQGNALMFSYEKSPEHYYRLEFRVLEISVEGKLINSRSYDEVVASGAKSATPSLIRSGDKVPVITSSYPASGGTTNSQYEYFRIGTDIDVHKVAVLDGTLRLYVTADLSTISSVAPATPNHPITRTTRWDSNVIVPIGKPTVIFSSDNNAGNGKTELELTAVPLEKESR